MPGADRHAVVCDGSDLQPAAIFKCENNPVDFETEFYRYENKEREQRRKDYEADPDSLANVLALTLSMRGEGTISEAAWEKIQAPMGQIEEQWGRQEISRQEYEKGIISLLKSVWGTEK